MPSNPFGWVDGENTSSIATETLRVLEDLILTPSSVALDLRNMLMLLETLAMLLALFVSCKAARNKTPKAKQVAAKMRCPRSVEENAGSSEPAAPTSTKLPSVPAGHESGCSSDEARASCKAEPRRRATPKTRALVDLVHSGDTQQLPMMLRISCMKERGEVGEDHLCYEERCSELVQTAMLVCISKSLFNEAMCAFEAVEDFVGVGTRTIWSILLFVAAKADNAERGLSAFQKLRAFGEPGGKDLLNVVRCSISKGDLAGFEELLCDLKASGVELNAVTRNKVFEDCVFNGLFEFAEVLLVSGICTEVAEESLFAMTMKRCLMRGFPTRCFWLEKFMKAQGVELRGWTRGLLLEAAGRCKDSGAAREALEGLRVPDDSFPSIGVTNVVNSLVAAGMLSEGEEFLSLSQLGGAAPPASSYHLLIDAFRRAGRCREAQALYVTLQAGKSLSTKA